MWHALSSIGPWVGAGYYCYGFLDRIGKGLRTERCPHRRRHPVADPNEGGETRNPAGFVRIGKATEEHACTWIHCFFPP